MKSVLLSLACAGGLLLAHEAWAAERLVYAIVHKGPDFSAAKTEIAAVDPVSARKQTLFLDEKAAILLPQHLYVLHFPVAGGNKIFARALPKNREGRAAGGSAGLYELSADGSNSFRRIAPASEKTSFTDVFVNSSGALAGSTGWVKQRQYIFVNDTGSGELLHEIPVGGVFLDCHASSIGWLPGSDRIFFTLEVGDEDGTSEESYGRAGSYIMDVADGKATRLPDWTMPGDSHPSHPARMLGILPSGDFLYYRHKALFAASPAGTGGVKPATIDFGPIGEMPAYGASLTISPSGRYIAAVKALLSSRDSVHNIYLKDLETGQERVLLSLPTDQLQGPFLGLVGWIGS